MPEMETHIMEKIIAEQWSPEQIKGHAEANGIPMVSHESIYKIIRNDKANGRDLYKNCRHKLKHRTRPVGGKALIIKDKRSIEERPSVVEDRSRIGDWEVDTIVGPANKGAILTMVDRKSGFLLIRKLEQGKNADGLSRVMIDALMRIKLMYRRLHSTMALNLLDIKRFRRSSTLVFTLRIRTLHGNAELMKIQTD